MNTLRSTTVSTDATGMSRRSTRRACDTRFAARTVAPATHAYAYAAAFAACGHTKVATVAWHQATTAAMHHARRPEEVASH